MKDNNDSVTIKYQYDFVGNVSFYLFNLNAHKDKYCKLPFRFQTEIAMERRKLRIAALKSACAIVVFSVL